MKIMSEGLFSNYCINNRCAYLEFTESSAVLIALQYNGVYFGGRQLKYVTNYFIFSIMFLLCYDIASVQFMNALVGYCYQSGIPIMHTKPDC